jgi:hypothetical protein
VRTRLGGSVGQQQLPAGGSQAGRAVQRFARRRAALQDCAAQLRHARGATHRLERARRLAGEAEADAAGGHAACGRAQQRRCSFALAGAMLTRMRSARARAGSRTPAARSESGWLRRGGAAAMC